MFSNNATSILSNEVVGVNVLNTSTIEYEVSAKGGSNITFGMALDDRIIDIYSNGADNTWYDMLNTKDDLLKTINSFSSIKDKFVIPKYLGTDCSHPSSNPTVADGTKVYGVRFTCSQSSYYYSKYWGADESVSVYGILFLYNDTTDNKYDIPEHSDFYVQTLLE